MGNFKEVFTNRHTVLPVVHVEGQKQTLKNAEIAYEEGADGVFLISMKGMHHRELLKIHEVVNEEFPKWFIGVNYLDLPAIFVFRNLNRNVSGVWTDNAGINESEERQTEAVLIKKEWDDSRWKGLYFGGVAFKYQRHVEDLPLTSRIASQFMDVVTTSGSETGSPPEPEKIRTMKTAIGEKPLAIASGISAENVEVYKENTDAFLVATSILIPGTQDFDRFRVLDLVSAVRGN